MRVNRAALRKAGGRILARRARTAGTSGPKWSPEAFCTRADGTVHGPQLSAILDRSPWLHLMCARQSGKTWADAAMLFDNALAQPGSTNVLLGLKGTGIRESHWFPVWRPLCDRYGIPAGCHNESVMRTTLPNRARVMFAGTDDLTNVRKYLGNRLDRSVFVIDEAQDQPQDVLRYILRTLLPPMLTPTSRVVLSGVLPDVAAGPFLELAQRDAESGTGGGAGSQAWSHHEWGRAANAHTPEAMEQLRVYCAAHGIDPGTDPQIQRDWYMRRLWLAGATAYGYDIARNRWSAPLADWARGKDFPPGKLMAVAPPDGCDSFLVGLDAAASSDRFAIVVWGYSSRRPIGVWQVAEWVTPRAAGTLESQYLAITRELVQRYRGVTKVVRDRGSDTVVDDVALREWGLVIEPPRKGKGSRKARVERFRDLLGTGRAHVLEGSELEHDLQLARFDPAQQAEGKYEWTSACHPDVGDAGGYPLFHVAEGELAPPPETEAQQQERLFRELWRPQNAVTYGPDTSDAGDGYGGDS